MDYLVKSLAELDAAGNVGLSTAMRYKKIQDYSIEELRDVISEGVGLAYLVPVALLNLIAQPLVDGGDLLVSVLEVEEEFWNEHPMYVSSVKRLCKVVSAQVSEGVVGEEEKMRIIALLKKWA